MTQKELLGKFGNQAGLTAKETLCALKTLIGIIRGEVQASGRLVIPDLGVFTLKSRKARDVSNVLTYGDKVHVPARKTIGFKPSANWKRAMNLE